jgi:tRNA nucleotidyltransferase (CCA-adding enzyme)
MQKFSNFMLLREAETKLKVNVPSDILDLYNLFKKNGKELYVVGGAVRDALLGKKPKDF